MAEEEPHYHQLQTQTPSSKGQHVFQSHTYTSPAYCFVCDKMLMGIRKQGLKCKVCNVDCHEKCQAQATAKSACANTEQRRSSMEKGVHYMIESTFLKPTYCQVCTKMLYGITKQGMRCSQCGFTTHKKCDPITPCPGKSEGATSGSGELAVVEDSNSVPSSPSRGVGGGSTEDIAFLSIQDVPGTKTLARTQAMTSESGDKKGNLLSDRNPTDGMSRRKPPTLSGSPQAQSDFVTAPAVTVRASQASARPSHPPPVPPTDAQSQYCNVPAAPRPAHSPAVHQTPTTPGSPIVFSYGHHSEADEANPEGLQIDDGNTQNRQLSRVMTNSVFELEPWYHGLISREQAEDRLNAQNCHGVYLIRESQTRPGSYTLSLRDEGGVVHSQIHQASDGTYFLSKPTNKHFRSMPQLIHHYSDYVDRAGAQIRLIQPCPKTGEKASSKMRALEPIADGEVSYAWPDGRRYVGEFKEGRPHGTGTLTWPDNRWYTGSWVEGRQNGQGTYQGPDGRTYRGEWSRGKQHGQGVLSWKDGREYDGNFVNGAQHGYGRLCWPDGRTFEGQWVCGHAHGQGKMLFPDGEWFEGEWADGANIGKTKSSRPLSPLVSAGAGGGMDAPQEMGMPADGQTKVCAICMERPTNTVFIQCGHMAACITCADMLWSRGDPCPICRGTIRFVQRVFAV